MGFSDKGFQGGIMRFIIIMIIILAASVILLLCPNKKAKMVGKSMFRAVSIIFFAVMLFMLPFTPMLGSLAAMRIFMWIFLFSILMLIVSFIPF